MIKGQWPRLKVSHCDLIVIPFGPFENRPLYFVTLVWNLLCFSRRFKRNKGWLKHIFSRLTELLCPTFWSSYNLVAFVIFTKISAKS